MRAIVILAGMGVALGIHSTGLAQTAGSVAPVAGAAPAADAGPTPDQLIAQLQTQLSAAGGEIQRLRGLLADKQATEARLKEVEAKNGRLVAISNELIASYSKRFHGGIKGPFLLGRRKFEAEMQDVSGRVYENRADAVAPPAAEAAPATDAPTSAPADQPAPKF